ncbi:MAG: fibronectin type III domain-containing protein [Patescibacteria group bacterium]
MGGILLGVLSAAAAVDITPPSTVMNLAVASSTPTSVTLQWSAPGDDGVSGTASFYDVRYRTAPMTESNFATSTPVAGEPFPHLAGTTETFTVSGLTPTTTYWFALRTVDEAGNTSALSNNASTTTPPDMNAPTITGVAVTDITTTSARISWLTDERATSQVNYGVTTGYSSSIASTTLTTVHAIDLTSLIPATLYHFIVSSTDAFGNTATSSDATFTTLATSIPPTATTTISAILKMDPRTLNRLQRGKVIRATVRLPRGITFKGLEIDSVFLNGSVKPADLKLRKAEWRRWGRYRRTLVMKFNSSDILPLIPTSTDQFTFTVTGKMNAGTFMGSDTVRVIPKPKLIPLPKREERIQEKIEKAKELLEKRQEQLEEREEKMKERMEKIQERLLQRIEKLKEKFGD